MRYGMQLVFDNLSALVSTAPMHDPLQPASYELLLHRRLRPQQRLRTYVGIWISSGHRVWASGQNATSQ